MHWQVRHFINLHKALVTPVVIALMAFYDAWASTTAWVYLALHGSYAALWLIKEATFRDRRFEEEIALPVGVFFVFVPLVSYWVAPWLITSHGAEAPPWRLALAVAAVVVGVFLHFAGDAQKHFVLGLRPGLIDDGLFARTRNPNYLGEMLIYAGFASLAQHWLAWVALLPWWAWFVKNMLGKDASISRHPGFETYRQRSGLLFPRILPIGRFSSTKDGSARERT